MKKRSIFSRIAILNEGREPFLNYLRNITPQAILLSFALLATYKSTIRPQHHTGLMVFALLFFSIFAAASYANITLFYKNIFKDSLNKNNASIKRLCRKHKFTKYKQLIMIPWLTLKYKWVELIELLCTVVFLQSTIMIVFYLAGLQYSAMLLSEK